MNIIPFRCDRERNKYGLIQRCCLWASTTSAATTDGLLWTSRVGTQFVCKTCRESVRTLIRASRSTWQPARTHQSAVLQLCHCFTAAAAAADNGKQCSILNRITALRLARIMSYSTASTPHYTRYAHILNYIKHSYYADQRPYHVYVSNKYVFSSENHWYLVGLI